MTNGDSLSWHTWRQMRARSRYSREVLPLVLDTSVARRVLRGEIALNSFHALIAHGSRIHLSDAAVLELTHAVLTGQIQWNDWMNDRQKLIELVDIDEPVLLGGRAGLQRAGYPVSERLGDQDVRCRAAALAAIWKIITATVSRDLLERNEIAVPECQLIVSLNLELHKQRMSEHRNAWSTAFKTFFDSVMRHDPEFDLKLPVRNDCPRASAEYFDAVSRKLDERSVGAAIPPSVRMDALLRVQGLWRMRFLRRREAYNPVKYGNDAFDFHLLHYLAFPAAICTKDDRLIETIRTTRSWQLCWVVRPEELASPSVHRAFEQPQWPRQIASNP